MRLLSVIPSITDSLVVVGKVGLVVGLLVGLVVVLIVVVVVVVVLVAVVVLLVVVFSSVIPRLSPVIATPTSKQKTHGHYNESSLRRHLHYTTVKYSQQLIYKLNHLIT